MDMQVRNGAPPKPRHARARALVRVEPWVLLAPALLLVLGLIAYPIARAVWIAVHQQSIFGFGPVTFVGLGNFAAAIGSPDFGTAVRNSLTWTLGAVALQLVFGMFGALLLNQRFPGRGIVRGLVLIPWATPSVLISLMWIWLLDPNGGFINNVLLHVGLISRPIAWLADPHTALPTLIAVDVWQGVPFFAVMLLAALQSVPEELRDAATVDGAGTWQLFWRITLPLIMPTVMVTTVLRLMWTANYIDLAYIMTGGGPGTATLTLPLEAYYSAFAKTDLGLGAAYALIQAALLVVMIAVYLRTLRQTEVI